MFKRAIQVQMVKTNKDDTANSNAARFDFDFDKINQIAKDQVKHVAIAIAAVYAVVTVLNTASEIAINAAPKK